MTKYLILDDDKVVQNIIVGPIDGSIAAPDYDVRVGYTFNDVLQLFLDPSITVEEFNSIRDSHIENLNEIVTWYTLFLTSSHFNGLTSERKTEIQSWTNGIFSIIPKEIEKLTNNNSCVLTYSIPFVEILEARPNIEVEV
jgi:hypothetical protein